MVRFPWPEFELFDDQNDIFRKQDIVLLSIVTILEAYGGIMEVFLMETAIENRSGKVIG